MNGTPTTPTTGAVKVDAERIKALRDQYLDTPLSIDIKESAERHGIANPPQMTVATTNGNTLWVIRYSTEHQSRSLFYSTDFRTLRELYPDNERIASVSDETRLVVSEPLVDLPGA
jgi:hypothetical protein